MVTNFGICYTQSGSVKKYERDELSISPNRVKLVDFNNISYEPYLPYIYIPHLINLLRRF